MTSIGGENGHFDWEENVFVVTLEGSGQGGTHQKVVGSQLDGEYFGVKD